MPINGLADFPSFPPFSWTLDRRVLFTVGYKHSLQQSRNLRTHRGGGRLQFTSIFTPCETFFVFYNTEDLSLLKS